MNNILLEGNPGIGKTTLLQKIAANITHLNICGFYTQEIRENKIRVGFRIDTFSGQSGVLSHVDFCGGSRVGKYGVDIDTFERIGVTELEKALDTPSVILIDEIGKMELYSNRFKEVLLHCFNSDQRVVATIMSRPHSVVDKLKSRQDVDLLKVTLKNRNQLVWKIIDRISI
jgi:nucleoside-triphosphatase